MDTIDTYEPAGGGGTDFDAIFDYLKKVGNVPKRLICFTDGYPCGSWGDAEYCDTTWIIHGDPNPNPPFGTYALYDDKGWYMETLYALGYAFLVASVIGVIYVFGKVLWSGFKAVKHHDD